MPIKVVELHHHGIRIGTAPEEVEKARQFYTEVLGLQTDPGRPNIPTIPGFWMYVGQGEQTARGSCGGNLCKGNESRGTAPLTSHDLSGC